MHLWVPFKELHQIVTAAIQKKQPDAIQDLESLLRKHKPDFISLLKNPVSYYLYYNIHLLKINVFFVFFIILTNILCVHFSFLMHVYVACMLCILCH